MFKDAKWGDPLREQEKKVLIMLSDGMKTPDIANAMNYSHDTIRNYIKFIKIKFGVEGSTLAHIVAIGIRKGIIA